MVGVKEMKWIKYGDTWITLDNVRGIRQARDDDSKYCIVFDMIDSEDSDYKWDFGVNEVDRNDRNRVYNRILAEMKDRGILMEIALIKEDK